MPDAARRPWWRRWWMLLAVFPAVLLGLVGIVVFFLVFASVPLPEDIGAATSTTVLDRNGDPYGQLTAQVGRVEVDLEDLPEHVPMAVLAAEDRGYYEHGGVSVTSILRAAVVNVRSGEAAQGGSTITQQYVKNAVVGADRTLVRKLKEAALALKLERRFTKDEILELYLNTIYWGRGAYGIEAAARTYYGVGATALTLEQASTLAGIISSPENLDPAEEPGAAGGRQRYVLDGMLDEGWIGPDTHAAALANGLPEVTNRSVSAGVGGYYLDAVAREVAGLVGDEAVFRGLTVTTEVDRNLQVHAENAVAGGLAEQPFTGALVAIDPTDGGVRALVGGPDAVAQPFNTADRARRQPGSAFKPVTLTAWVEAGLSPESGFAGGSSREVPDGQGGTTTVTNYSSGDRGPQTLREATWTSTNTTFLDAQQRIGPAAVVDAGRALGIPEDRDLPEVPTLTLGVASVSPVDMASAYATLAAGGVRSEPRLVRRVVGPEGELLYEAEPERSAVIEANSAYVVTDVLRGVIAGGTGRAADIGRPAAGKTGTTDDFRDAWFVGYTPQLATSVWVGNLDNSPMDGVTGGSVPARIWGAFMAAAHEGVDAVAFPEPDLRGLEVVGADNLEPEEPVCPSDTATAPPGDTSSEPAASDTAPSDCPSPSEEPTDDPSEEPTDPGPSDDPTCPPGVAGVLAGCASEEPTEEPSPEPSESPSTNPSPSSSPSDPDGPSEEPSQDPDPSPTPTSSDDPG